MQTTYRVRANELNNDLIRSLKSAYSDREIEITVNEVQDETEYLLGSAAIREHLLKAVADLDRKVSLVDVPVSSLQA